MKTASLETPIGELTVFVANDSLCGVAFPEHRDDLLEHLGRYFDALELERDRDPGGVCSRLRDYFDGDRSALDAIAVDARGTSFQRRVWDALIDIPMGATWSYARLAQEIGAPTAMRAVGAANGRNPVSIVIPCHRVIAADGTLCGYGGGLDRKRWLLRHERAAFKDVESQTSRQAALAF